MVWPLHWKEFWVNDYTCKTLEYFWSTVNQSKSFGIKNLENSSGKNRDLQQNTFIILTQTKKNFEPKDFPRITTIELTGNMLNFLPELDGIDLSSTKLLLENNTFHCNCEMNEFYKWIMNSKEKVGKIECSAPEKFDGYNMLDLKQREVQGSKCVQIRNQQNLLACTIVWSYKLFIF